MEVKQVVEAVEGAAVVGGATLFGLSRVFGSRAKAIDAAQKTLVDTLNQIVDAQEKRSNEQDEKIDGLTLEVRELREAIVKYACPNAPFCQNRPSDGIGGLAFSHA